MVRRKQRARQPGTALKPMMTHHILSTASPQMQLHLPALASTGSRQEKLLEAGRDDESDQGGAELTNTSHSDERAYHGTTPSDCGEFRVHD